MFIDNPRLTLTLTQNDKLRSALLHWPSGFRDRRGAITTINLEALMD